MEAQKDQVIWSRPHSKWKRQDFNLDLPHPVDSNWTTDSIHSLMPKCPLTALSNKLLAVHWLRVLPPVQGSTTHSQGPGKRPHPHLPASSFASLQYILQVAARVSFKKNFMKNITCTKRIHFTVNIHIPTPKFNHEHFTNFITDLSLHPSLNPSYFLMHLKLVVDISTLPLNMLACIQNRFFFKMKGRSSHSPTHNPRNKIPTLAMEYKVLRDPAPPAPPAQFLILFPLLT